MDYADYSNKSIDIIKRDSLEEFKAMSQSYGLTSIVLDYVPLIIALKAYRIYEYLITLLSEDSYLIDSLLQKTIVDTFINKFDVVFLKKVLPLFPSNDINISKVFCRCSSYSSILRDTSEYINLCKYATAFVKDKDDVEHMIDLIGNLSYMT